MTDFDNEKNIIKKIGRSILLNYKIPLNYKYIILFLIVFFSFIRFINLDADPGLFKRIGDIGDEGYWGFEARNLVLYNQYITDDFTQSSATAPLYTLFSLIFLKIFGVSLYTSRLTSAIFGILSIFLVFLFLRKYNEKIALCGSLFLCINYNYFVYNRIGHVETLVSFFLLLTFYFFENKDSWFGAGISYALAICAKIATIWFFPAIFLYFIFKTIRNEVEVRKILHFIVGGLIIGFPFLLYEYHFWNLFQITVEGLSHNALGLNLLLGWPSRIVYLFTNSYFINPINIFLVICSIKYLKDIQFINLFSNNFKEYIKSLSALDIVIISWVIGYSISLVLFSDMSDRRLQLFSVILSIIPALILFRENREKYNYQKLNILQNFICFIPFIVAGAIFGKSVLAFTLGKPILGFNLYVRGFLSTVMVIILSIMFSSLPDKLKRILSTLSFVSVIAVINLPFVSHVSSIFNVDDSSKIVVIMLLFFTLTLFMLFAYAIDRKVAFINVINIVGIALIIFALATPTFSVNETSKYLNGITDNEDYLIGNEDYLIGPLGHELSFNAKYHPVWWIPNRECYKKMNRDFVRDVKPEYFIYCEKWKGSNLDYAWPTKDNLRIIGATNFEKIYSFGLYPVFGKNRANFSLYRVFYSE